MAIQSSFKNMVLCLFSVCLICSALLAVVYAVTKEPIEIATQNKTTNSIAAVVPAFDGVPVKDSITVSDKQYMYYVVSKDGKPVGYAIESSAVGFSGPVNVMVGMTAEGVVYGTRSKMRKASVRLPVQGIRSGSEDTQGGEGWR